MTVISVVVEELQEAIGALEGLRLANKRTAADLDDADYKAMSHAGEQVVDLLSAINTLLSGWHEWYGFDIDAQAVKATKSFLQGVMLHRKALGVAEVQRLYPRPAKSGLGRCI